MLGLIRKRDVLTHPRVTIQCFGWRIFFRALLAKRGRTFLSVLADADFLKLRRQEAPALVKRCIALELKAEELYRSLANRFRESDAARRFFSMLALQEAEHADVLQVCRASVDPAAWDTGAIAPFVASASRLLTEMEDVASRLDEIRDLTDALRLALRIESSEVNVVFQGILTASHSRFVTTVEPLRTATRRHLQYVRAHIPELAPELKDDCAVLERALGW